MNIDNAREILGEDSRSMSDELIYEHISTATLLKDFFFYTLVKNKGSDPQDEK